MPAGARRMAKTDARTAGERVRRAATRLFADRGFARTSMRDLARESGLSLSGLYHHFAGKDDLLFELQRDAYERLTRPLAAFPADLPPEEKLRRLIHNHVEFFSSHITAMKVLSHESGALDGDMGRRMRRMRRNYYNRCLAIVSELLDAHHRDDLVPRTATMTLFGMINWIYTWYKPSTDGPADVLAAQMTELFLNGVARSRKTDARKGG